MFHSENTDLGSVKVSRLARILRRCCFVFVLAFLSLNKEDLHAQHPSCELAFKAFSNNLEPGFEIDPAGHVIYHWSPPRYTPDHIVDEMHAYFEQKRDLQAVYGGKSRALESDEYVTQHEAKAASHGLKTSGLFNCSSVMFRHGGKFFQMHVDQSYDSLPTLHKALVENFDLNELRNDPGLRIFVNDGSDLESYDTLARIRTVLSALNLEQKIVYGGPVKDSYTWVGINERGPYMYQNDYLLTMRHTLHDELRRNFSDMKSAFSAAAEISSRLETLEALEKNLSPQELTKRTQIEMEIADLRYRQRRQDKIIDEIRQERSSLVQAIKGVRIKRRQQAQNP